MTLKIMFKIHILFYCIGDTVYMGNEKLLEEYVLNQYGAVYVGNWRQIGARPWLFGQVSQEKSRNLTTMTVIPPASYSKR